MNAVIWRNTTQPQRTAYLPSFDACKWLLLLISGLSKPKWPVRASIGDTRGEKGGGRAEKELKNLAEVERNRRTIPHLRLSEAIYLRKWGCFWWEGVCWYVCPPDPSVISHIKGSTTRQLAYRREWLQEFGGFSEICLSSQELSEPTGERKSKSKSSMIFLILWIFDIHAAVSFALAFAHPRHPYYFFSFASEAFTMRTNSMTCFIF